MKRYIKSSSLDESVYDDCYEEVMEYILQGMDEGEYFSYDDVVADVYAGIQDYFDKTHAILTDELEDQIYEDIMQGLEDFGYIDHKNGLLLYEYTED